MRKILICFLAIIVCLTACTADAAKTAQKEKRFKAVPTKQAVLEEEQTNNRKKISKKTALGCGQDHPIRVAGFVTNAPFGWVNVIPPQGSKPAQYVNGGFSYDLFEQIVKDAGLNIQNVGYTSYQEAMKDLRRGKIDVVAGAYFDKRILGTGVNLMFPSYFSNPIVPVFLKGKEKEVNSWNDLKGLKGIVRQEENIYSLVFNQLPKDIEIKQISGSKKAFTMLLNGEADYIITSLYAGEAEIRRYKLVDDVYFSPKALVSAELFFVFSSHSDCPAIKKKLEPILRKLKENDEAYRKAFIEYIDEWGLRFKDSKGLKQELYEARQNAPTVSDVSDKSENTIASDVSDIASDSSDTQSDSTETKEGSTPNSAKPDSDHPSGESAPEQSPQSSDKTNQTSVQKPAVSVEKATDSKPNRPLTAAERIRNL